MARSRIPLATLAPASSSGSLKRRSDPTYPKFSEFSEEMPALEGKKMGVEDVSLREPRDSYRCRICYRTEGNQMSKMVRSQTEPETLGLDVVRNGSVRILCRWDVREITVEDEDGPRTEYEYKEWVIWWALPSPEYLERRGRRQVLTDAGRAYLASVEDEILGWAMAAGV